MHFKRECYGQILVCMVLILVLTCSAAFSDAPPVSPKTFVQAENQADPAKAAGIRIESLRPTAAGHMLDLRYRVIDPSRASEVLNRNNKAFIIDQTTRKTLPVPISKIGHLRQTTLKPEVGRIYFAMFSNPGGIVKPGSRVTLVIGKLRVENILLQEPMVKPGVKPGASPKARGATRK